MTVKEAKAVATRYSWNPDHVGPDGRYCPNWYQGDVPAGWEAHAEAVKARVRASYNRQLAIIRANRHVYVPNPSLGFGED